MHGIAWNHDLIFTVSFMVSMQNKPKVLSGDQKQNSLHFVSLLTLILFILVYCPLHCEELEKYKL